ncbi:MAG: polymer-forming cytoskeletal protein [Proteobacteria bacterium]|nr:polymer-forming cytoskeletal protein [Pseudomonadota bacterium]MBU1688056.1 polymer-forming cytoskeletal protein [Pseudomonadota bacterium]
MGLFKGSADSAQTENNGGISSIIGKGMTVVGDLTFSGKVRIDGNIEGNITGDYLILSQDGNITGDIEAATVVCHGQIDGNLRIAKLYLKKSGVINGRLDTSDLSVESGGVLNGEIRSHAATQEVGLNQITASPEKEIHPPSLPHAIS